MNTLWMTPFKQLVSFKVLLIDLKRYFNDSCSSRDWQISKNANFDNWIEHNGCCSGKCEHWIHNAERKMRPESNDSTARNSIVDIISWHCGNVIFLGLSRRYMGSQKCFIHSCIWWIHFLNCIGIFNGFLYIGCATISCWCHVSVCVESNND